MRWKIKLPDESDSTQGRARMKDSSAPNETNPGERSSVSFVNETSNYFLVGFNLSVAFCPCTRLDFDELLRSRR